MRTKKLAKIAATTLILSLLGLNLSSALANTTDSGAAVQTKIDDLRQIIIYSETLEAENGALKQSLESERAAVDEMIEAQERERQQTAEYTDALNKELKQAKRQTTAKNYIIIILTGAVIGLAASK